MTLKRLLTTFVLALVISATAASVASARPTDAVGTTVLGESVDSGYSSVNAISGAPASEPTQANYVGEESSSSADSRASSGFDWGDAAIGAAATFAVMMIAQGGVLVLSGRRRRQPGRAAAA